MAETWYLYKTLKYTGLNIKFISLPPLIEACGPELVGSGDS